MKKLAIGILSSALILGACSNHSEDNNDNKTSSNSNTTKSNKSNDESNTQNSNKKEYNEITMSDLFKDGKERLVYNFKSNLAANGENEIEKLQKNPEDAFKNEFYLDAIYNIKDNKGFEYVFDPSSPDKAPQDFTLDKLSKYSLEENKNKFHKLQEMNLKEYNDSYTDMQPLQLHNEPEEIEKFFYTKNNKVFSEDFFIAKYYPRDEGDVWEEHNKKIWKPAKENVMFPQAHFPYDKMISVEPFTINGKTYSGLAIPYKDSVENKIVGYQRLVITEIPKNTKVVMDKDTSNSKVERFEDTDEQKQKREKEAKQLDNL